MQEDQFFCYQGDELHKLVKNDQKVELYELVGFVVEIRVEEERNTHLAALING